VNHIRGGGYLDFEHPPPNRGSYTPLYTPSPLYGVPYPPSPWGVLGSKRGVNPVNEICIGYLRKIFWKIFWENLIFIWYGRIS